MDQLADALRFTAEQRPATTYEIGAHTFSDKALHRVNHDIPEDTFAEAVRVSTLGGFADLIEYSLDKFEPLQYMIHVQSPTQVSLVAKNSDKWGRRRVLATAQALAGLSYFPFNHYIDTEPFVINLLSLFEMNVDRDDLIKIASKVKSEESATTEDDGVSQRITQQGGVHLAKQVVVQPIRQLAPYRTFREVSQPVSNFLFRVKEGGQCALFEADGGAWQISCIDAIASWLRNRVASFEDTNAASIPIIS